MTVLVLFLPLTVAHAYRTDYASRSPGAVTLPSAGGRYWDPIFNTKIIRVTDSSYGAHCYHAYSYWPAFNYNNTRLLLACDDKPLLFKFDPSTDTLTRDGILWGSDGPHVEWQGAIWSPWNANVLYAVDQSGLRLWKLDVSLRGAAGYTKLHDFSNIWGSNRQLNSLSMSEDGDVFAFRVLDKTTGARVAAAVWERSSGKLWIFPTYSGYSLNEILIDKNGCFAQIKFDDETTVIWAFRYGDKHWLTTGVRSQDAGGHYDVGADYLANSDQWAAGVVVRTFDALTPAINIVKYLRPDGSMNWTLCDHVSLRTNDESFVVGSTYGGDGTWAAFEKEIYLAYTDGHGFARLAHTRSSGTQGGVWRYWTQPRAVVSRNGRFIVYTSDLGSSTRSDVMILKVPSELWPS